MDAKIDIEVVYALPQRQEVVRLKLAEGATVQQAIDASGLLQRHPELEPGKRNKVGIFAKLTKLDAPLRDRDRVEIYRPLIADPKEVRRRRAEQGKAMKKGGGDAGEEAAD
ncbi:MAG: RnfH family protein [Rhodocyclaceae bacterium]|nr:RnfH family protein [Rhodocyclaceae bacterium]